MKKYTFLGLAVLALIPTVTQTVELTGKTIYISVLPAFAGLLLIFFGTEKLSYNNRFMKSVCGTSSALAVPAFIFAVAQLYPFYLPYVFTDASGGKRFFAAVIKICADIYDGGQYIFFGLSSIYLAVVVSAFTSEMKHRAVTAKVSDDFSHKDAYGDKHYSKKAYELYTVVCTVFTAVFAVVGVLYIVNQFLGGAMRVQWLTFDIRLETLLLPVGILFLPFAYTAVEMLGDKRREDRLKEKAEAEKN